MSESRPEDAYVRSDDVIETDLESELILMDPETGEMFSLNETGRFVWRALSGQPAEEIAARLANAFDVRPEAAQADVRALLESLHNAGLVSPTGDGAS